MSIPWNIYPRPQMRRESFICLNGEWDFEFDFGNSGVNREMFKENAEFTKKITVPFCVESELSGIGYKDFIPAVWYRRKINITKEQLQNRVFIIFGAVDFHATLYVNEVKVDEHFGGYTSFRMELTKYLKEGENTITVVVIKWSDATFIEDQDHWYLPGLSRSVYLYSTGESCIVKSGLTSAFSTTATSYGSLSYGVTVTVSNSTGFVPQPAKVSIHAPANIAINLFCIVILFSFKTSSKAKKCLRQKTKCHKHFSLYQMF